MKDFLKKILFILTKQDKRRLILILLMLLGSALLDLIGVSAILPIVSLLNIQTAEFDPSQVSGFINFISKIFGGEKRVDTMALILLCMLAIFYVIKTAYVFASTYVMTKFSMSVSRRLTRRQMETYLSMPYEYHLNNNSSTLIRKCTYDVSNFTNTINLLLNFIVKALTMIAIIVYLFIQSYIVTLIIGGSLAIFSIFILVILKPHIKRVSRRNQYLNSQNYKYLSQAFNGIKESKICNNEKFFIDAYDSNIININKMSIRVTMYNAIPSNALELVGMVGLVAALVIIILAKNALHIQNTYIIETFSVFAYAVIKLLPCVTYVNATINNLVYYKLSIDTIYTDMTSMEGLSGQKESFSDEGNFEFNDKIEIKDLSFAYSTAPDRTILDNVNCTIKKNTSFAFCGVSGAGKTTIIDNILGLLSPTGGAILVDGRDIKENIRGWRKNISYIPQTIYLMDDSIRNNIAFGIKENEINDEKIYDALEKAQLKDFVMSLPDKLNTIIGERGVRLSGGQRQRIGIARAFYRNTNIVVFDEATSALDYETEKAILDHVNEVAKDHTLIIITHRLNTIENCDHIYKIDTGKINKVK